MTRSSILPLLLLSLTLAACSGGSDEAAESSVSTSEPPRTEAASAPEGSLTMERRAADATSAPAPATPNGATQPEFATADTAAVTPPQPGTVPGEAAVSLNPMLVRTGRAVVQVDSLEQGITRIRQMAQHVGGIVGNTSITAGDEDVRQAEMELRIPSGNFDRAVSGLSPIGKVRSVNVTAEDVGEEYTDVSARVANARRLEARLLDLLDTRSGRLEEVLNLEREVARVREEIERYEGRLRYLRTRSSISMLTVTLHEGETFSGRAPGEHPIRDAFATAWRSFIEMVAGIIASLGVLIPLGFLGYLGWRLFRHVRRREAERDAAYREALRRERERNPAPAAEPEEPALRP
jgi:hypothetical protein